MGNENFTIWRYFKHSHFLDILERKEFSFSNITTMKDKTEGSLKEIFIYNCIVFGGKQKNKSESDRNEILSAISEKTDKFYISCWTMADEEDLTFWKNYTFPDDAIAIKSTVQKFIESIPLSFLLNKRMIKYYPKRKNRFSANPFSISERIFSKFDTYKAENEFRFVLFEPNNLINGQIIRYQYIPIDYSLLISEIFLSPLMDLKLIESIINSINDLNPNLNDKIKLSKIKFNN